MAVAATATVAGSAAAVMGPGARRWRRRRWRRRRRRWRRRRWRRRRRRRWRWRWRWRRRSGCGCRRLGLLRSRLRGRFLAGSLLLGRRLLGLLRGLGLGRRGLLGRLRGLLGLLLLDLRGLR